MVDSPSRSERYGSFKTLGGRLDNLDDRLADGSGGAPTSDDLTVVADALHPGQAAAPLTTILGEVGAAFTAQGGELVSQGGRITALEAGGGGTSTTLLSADSRGTFTGATDGAGTLDPLTWTVLGGPYVGVVPSPFPADLSMSVTVTAWGSATVVSLFLASPTPTIETFAFHSDGSVEVSGDSTAGVFVRADGQTVGVRVRASDGLTIFTVNGVEVHRSMVTVPIDATAVGVVTGLGATLGAWSLSSVAEGPAITNATFTGGTGTGLMLTGGTVDGADIEGSAVGASMSPFGLLADVPATPTGKLDVVEAVVAYEGYLDNERDVEALFTDAVPGLSTLMAGTVADVDQPTDDYGRKVQRGDRIGALGDVDSDGNGWFRIVHPTTGQWGVVPSTGPSTPTSAAGWANAISTNVLSGGSKLSVLHAGVWCVFHGFRVPALGATPETFTRGGPSIFYRTEHTGYWAITGTSVPSTLSPDGTRHWLTVANDGTLGSTTTPP